MHCKTKLVRRTEIWATVDDCLPVYWSLYSRPVIHAGEMTETLEDAQLFIAVYGGDVGRKQHRPFDRHDAAKAPTHF